ncbi:hypothetical protein MKS83_00535 [Chryseobacterium sp. Y16C]|nr:hypothetical protein [Chryseobacterium sp. Y16C]UMQ42185.1 hypothetical protein MKS83_00535 [Chryseobacterium sp. Y16C]
MNSFNLTLNRIAPKLLRMEEVVSNADNDLSDSLEEVFFQIPQPGNFI